MAGEGRDTKPTHHYRPRTDGHPDRRTTLTPKELKEYLELKDQIFGDQSFIIPDETDPQVKRFNELGPKFLKLMKGIKHSLCNTSI